MDWKKFFIAFVAAFGFIFLFGFLWYGKLMHGAHQEVPILWRTEADFGNHFSTLVFGHIVMAFFLTLLCARFVPGGGPGACATLAILVALIYAGADLITFAVQPLTTKILCGWIVGDVISGIRLGILLEIAAIGMRLAIYAVQPFPAKLIIYGSISGLIEMIIVGAIVGAIYKPAVGRTA